MTNRELGQYLLQSLNMGLGSIIQGETSYTKVLTAKLWKKASSFFSLLSQIALLGRATKVHLFLVSQRFDHTSIPISVREQLNVLIQIGNINSKTTQFLFPDLDPEGIVIPIGKGTGLIQIIDNEHPYQVLPLLCPTYYTKKGIL
ncbi:putative FtsK/SpoIIIE family protein [Streptococcus mutans 11VS1]|nr:putative FtsK/SpoIIIE family protein [Streptococcus mutans 11VS1]